MESNNDGRIDDEDTAARHIDDGAVVNEGTARNNENDVAANGGAIEAAAEDYNSTTATSTTNSNADDEEDAISITDHRADGSPRNLLIADPRPPLDLVVVEEEVVEDEEEDEDEDEEEDEDEDVAVLNKLLQIADQHPNLPERQRRKVMELAHNFLAATDHGVGNNDDDDDNDDDGDNDDDDDDEADQVVLELLVALVKETLATMDDNNSNSNNNSIVVESAREFVVALGVDIHDMVTDQNHTEEGYAGLDSTRDTEDEVETALRLYPEVLAQRRRRAGLNFLPIHCIMCIFPNHTLKPTCNRLAIGFVPLFAAQAIKYQLFDEEERGGLLIDMIAENNTTRIVTALNFLQSTYYSSDDEENQKLNDTTCLEVLVQLRGSRLLKKEDIQRYRLLHNVYHSGKRFGYLAEWDPSALLQTDISGNLPLNCNTQTIRQYQVMLDTHFRYFAKAENVICLLFQKNIRGRTPFWYACKRMHQNDVTDRSVHNAVDEALKTSRSFPSLDIGKGMVMAATNNNIALDGVYYFIRRQPDTMINLLRHTTSPLAPLAPSSP